MTGNHSSRMENNDFSLGPARKSNPRHCDLTRPPGRVLPTILITMALTIRVTRTMAKLMIVTMTTRMAPILTITIMMTVVLISSVGSEGALSPDPSHIRNAVPATRSPGGCLRRDKPGLLLCLGAQPASSSPPKPSRTSMRNAHTGVVWGPDGAESMHECATSRATLLTRVSPGPRPSRGLRRLVLQDKSSMYLCLGTQPD